MVALTPPPTNNVPSRVFPLPGWTGPILPHWGQGITGGTDLMVTSSGVQPVVSMVSGKVSYVGSQANASHSGGNSVEIHGIDGLDYYYAHLAAPLGLKLGDTVAAGQMLGNADTTGDAAGGPPHLHIGIGHGIVTGIGPTGGTGQGFDAVGMLKALVGSPSANNPQIVSPQVQQTITTSQPGGTIVLGAPASAPISTNLEDRIKWLAQLLAAAGVPLEKIPQMVAISLAENGSSDPNASSSTNDLGLWQINIPTWVQALVGAGIISSASDLKDPLKNAAAAWYVLVHSSLNAWTTHQQGKDIPILKDVQTALAGIDLGAIAVGGTAGGDPASGGSSGGSAGGDCNCGTWDVGPFSIPDLGCVLQCSVAKIINQWKAAWLAWLATWESQHAANWFFVGVGFILAVVGILMLIQAQTGGLSSNPNIGKMQSKLTEMEAVA